MLIYTASCEASAAVSSGSGATTDHNIAMGDGGDARSREKSRVNEVQSDINHWAGMIRAASSH